MEREINGDREQQISTSLEREDGKSLNEQYEQLDGTWQGDQRRSEESGKENELKNGDKDRLQCLYAD